MTKPKEEECEACCGSGYINFWTDDGHISMRTCRRCDGYGYIRVKPMTNEDYLRSCNTEELAIFICNNLPQEIEGTLENRFWSALYSQYPIEPMNAYHEVMKWLKEEHKNGN